jgi:hypothetical protein
MIIPEPAGDIRAQLRAVIDPEHPKRACFATRENYGIALPLDADADVETYSDKRREGCLFTIDAALAKAFRAAPAEPEAEFDRAMAAILGYPEAKPDVLLACQGRLFTLARVVQARTAEDWVVHEALTSPAMLGYTTEELQNHVPSGGRLVVLTPADVIRRRLALREAGK